MPNRTPAFLRWFANRRRGICAWSGFAVLFVLTMRPPWVQTNIPYGRLPAQRWKLAHATFLQPPHPAYDPSIVESFVEVDYPRMLTEIAAGESFVLALYLTWGKQKPKP
jgi:hypothetical protein